MQFKVLNDEKIITNFIRQIKSNKKIIYSNYYKSNYWLITEINKTNILYNIIDNCLLILHKDNDIYRLYYITSSLENFDYNLKNINFSKKLICEIIEKNNSSFNIKNIFKENNFLFLNSLINLSKKITLSDLNKNKNYNINITYPTVENIKEISYIHKNIFDKYIDNFLSDEEIHEAIINKQIFISTINNQIAGYIIFDIKNIVSQLKYWAVNKSIAPKDTGNALFYSMCRLMKENSILECWCKQDNNTALTIYKNKGFKDTEKICHIFSLN